MTRKIFKQWLMGTLFPSENIEDLSLVQIQEIVNKAEQIIRFGEEYRVFNFRPEITKKDFEKAQEMMAKQERKNIMVQHKGKMFAVCKTCETFNTCLSAAKCLKSLYN